MPYCLKCGAKVDDTVTFCPICGTQLKDDSPTAISPAPSAPNSSPQSQPQTNATEKEKPQEPKEPLKNKLTKRDYAFILYLDAGLILITFGGASILDITNPRLGTFGYFSIMLTIMALILILSIVYVFVDWKRRFQSTPSETDNPPSMPTP